MFDDQTRKTIKLYKVTVFLARMIPKILDGGHVFLFDAFLFMFETEVKLRTQRSRPRTKKFQGQGKGPTFWGAESLEAMDRNGRGQG